MEPKTEQVISDLHDAYDLLVEEGWHLSAFFVKDALKHIEKLEKALGLLSE